MPRNELPRTVAANVSEGVQDHSGFRDMKDARVKGVTIRPLQFQRATEARKHVADEAHVKALREGRRT